MGNSPVTSVTPVRSRPVTVKPRLSIVEDVDQPTSVTVRVDQARPNVNSRPTSSFNEEEKKSPTIYDDRTSDERVRALLRQVCINTRLEMKRISKSCFFF